MQVLDGFERAPISPVKSPSLDDVERARYDLSVLLRENQNNVSLEPFRQLSEKGLVQVLPSV